MYSQYILIGLCVICLKCEGINYSFVIHTVVGDPDGYRRPVIIVYNANHTTPTWDRQRPFPAPLISARSGESLEVKFRNMLRGQSASIHFHGLHMHNNPWMDGVEMLTQCPINFGETFTYRFNLTQVGTFWYHSHSHQQYSDGLIGPVIIYPKEGEKDPILEQYPYDERSDYPIILQEWYHESWQDIMTGYQSFFNSSKYYRPRYPWPPTSLLINGHGRFDCHTTDCSVPSENKKCNESIQCIPLRESYFGECKPMVHDLDEFVCHNGKYIRLRLINAASGSPIRFWIDQHSLLIVARDSIPIIPYKKSYIAIPVGQRLDVIVPCDQKSNFKYKMYVALPESFVAGVNPDSWTEALFVYPNSSRISEPQLPPESNFTDDVLFEFKHLKPLNAQNDLTAPAVQRFVYKFSVIYDSTDEDTLEEWQINGKTFITPSHAPLLQSIYFDKDIKAALPVPTIGRLGNSHETHIDYLEYGNIYEVVLINNDIQQHPFHLHGYSVNFTTVGTLINLTNDYYDECTEHLFNMNTVNYDQVLPPFNQTSPTLSIGDSFTVPRKGYVVLRFKADNAGPWFLHCHMEWHIAPGLGVILSVGHKNGTSYEGLIPDPPVKEFFLCGSTKQPWSNFVRSATTRPSFDCIMVFTIIFVVCTVDYHNMM